MKNHTIVFVSPVLRIPTQGRDRQTFNVINPKTGQLEVGKNMNKTREVGTEVVLKFLIDYQTNRYVTGLDELIINPFQGMEVEEVLSKYNLPAQWQDLLPKIVKQSQLSRQIYFEILDGTEPDYYTSEVKGGTMFNFKPYQLSKLKDREETYISQFSVTFYDKPNRFTDETPRQRMAIQLVKNHSSIAKDKVTANPSEHLFYISEENEAAMERMRKQDIIDEAIYRKHELKTKSSEFMLYKIASLLTTVQEKPIVKGVENKDTVKQALDNYINDRTYQMANIEKFLKVMELLNTPEGKQRLEVMYLIQQGFNTDVLKNSEGYIVWKSRSASKNIYKWTDYDKLVNFILSDMLVYDPSVEDTTVINWYAELFNEVKNKNAWVE